MKQIIALILAVLTICLLLVACGSDASSDTKKADGVVLPTDAEGATVYATDAEGYPVYPTDAQGEPVYATDAAGEPILAHDAQGNAITGNGGATGNVSTDTADPTSAPATSAPATSAPATSGEQNEPATDATEGEIPVVIATLPLDGYELPILP